MESLDTGNFASWAMSKGISMLLSFFHQAKAGTLVYLKISPLTNPFVFYKGNTIIKLDR